MYRTRRFQHQPRKVCGTSRLLECRSVLRDRLSPTPRGIPDSAPSATSTSSRSRTSAPCPGSKGTAHLVLGGTGDGTYADALALFPKILFRNCENIALWCANCTASVSLERCSLSMAALTGLRGEIRVSDCHLQPEGKEAEGDLYELDSTIGTRFTNCTIHAPVIDGKARPERIDQLGFLKINQSLRHYHLNTALANSVVRHLREQGTPPEPSFLAMLKSHHELDE